MAIKKHAMTKEGAILSITRNQKSRVWNRIRNRRI